MEATQVTSQPKTWCYRVALTEDVVLPKTYTEMIVLADVVNDSGQPVCDLGDCLFEPDQNLSDKYGIVAAAAFLNDIRTRPSSPAEHRRKHQTIPWEDVGTRHHQRCISSASRRRDTRVTWRCPILLYAGPLQRLLASGARPSISTENSLHDPQRTL